MSEDQTPSTEMSKDTVRLIIKSVSAVFILGGIALLLLPYVMEFVLIDESTDRILGAVCVFVGIVDNIVSDKLFPRSKHM